MAHLEWNPEDDEILRENYRKWPSKQIAEVLNRPQRSIWNRAKNLGLSGNVPGRPGKKREKPVEEEIVNREQWYDPFDRPLPVFCVKKVTVHMCYGGES